MGDPNLRACVQPEWLPIALNKADCVQIRPDTRVCNSDYLCALLNEPETETMAHQLILGQTRLRISMGRLRELNVPVPPINIQTSFSERLRELQGLGYDADRSVACLDSLFASLQHRAFRGEL
jgi:type I restriction enzyme S subunit